MKQMKNKAAQIIGAALTGILMLNLAACGSQPGGGASQTATETKAETKTESKTEGTTQAGQTEAPNSEAPQDLTIWMGSWWEDQIPVIVETYKKENPNVNLTIEALPVDGYVDKAVTTILGGGGPDILAVDMSQMGTLIDKNLLSSWNESIGDMDLSDFAGIIDACKRGDMYYGLPYRTSASIMFYNKTMFDEAGVPYPEEGWTYEDMLEIARKLTIPGQQYGVGIAASNADPSNVFTCLTPIIWACGADYLNEDETECILNTPEAIEAVGYFTGLYTTEKVVPEGSINYTLTKDVMPLFIENKVAMMMGGDHNAVEFDTKYPDLDYGYCVPPKAPALAGGWCFTVPVTAKNPEAAYEFAKWFLQPGVLGELTIRIPAWLKATEYGVWNSPLYQTVLKSAMDGRLSPQTPVWTDMQKVIIVEIQNIMQGTKTVEQGCEDMTRQCNSLLK